MILLKNTALSSLICCCFVSGKPDIPMVDMGFAISATAANSKEHFQKMKQVINTFIDKYGSQKMAYSVTTFGSSPTIYVRFSDSASPDDLLKGYVDSIPKNTAQASLDKALYEAKELFKASNGARRDALKVLVVITDKKSDSLAQDVKKSALRLDENDIRVIGVALGDEGDGELDDITDVKDDVINTTDTTSPAKIAEKIMERVLNSKSSDLSVFDSDVVLESNQIQDLLLLETILLLSSPGNVISPKYINIVYGFFE